MSNTERPCPAGWHDFIPISSSRDPYIYDIEHQIRWCTKCGTVKKVSIYDSRERSEQILYPENLADK